MAPGGRLAARHLMARDSALRLAAGVCVSLLTVAAVLAWHRPIAAVSHADRSSFAQVQIERGANLAFIGNCAGCHTRRDGAPFAGGLALRTGFGTVFSTNITPAPTNGLGAWSLQAFARAMREGISRDGHLLYPAFPYDHFSGLTDPDIAALYAYLETRDPVETAPPPNDMTFPFSWRPLMAAWNLLFLRPHVASPDTPATGAAWARGAYLTETLAHCGACHTPRNFLGAERRGEAFAGGRPEGWYAPPLNRDSPSPRPWTATSLAQYLRTGIAPMHAIAGGPMQGVTEALGRADATDVEAIAAYVVSLMGPQTAAREQRAAMALARAQAPLAASGPSLADPRLANGATVYANACASCHDPGRGESSNAALRLPLAVALHDADPRSLLNIVREGISPVDGAAGRIMPAFGNALTDEQLTDLAAYLRQAAAGAPPWPDLARTVTKTRVPASPGEAS